MGSPFVLDGVVKIDIFKKHRDYSQLTYIPDQQLLLAP